MDWKLVDNELNKYLEKYKKKQLILKDNIQNIFNLNISDINNYISNQELSRFKRFLEINKEVVKDNEYVLYLLNKYIKKTKILFKDMIKIMILIEYAKFENDIKQDQIDTLINIGKWSFEIAKNLCKSNGFKGNKKIKWLDSILLAFILTPLNTGITYKEQNDSTAIYNTDELYKQVVLDISRNQELNVDNVRYLQIFSKQLRRELNKKTIDNKDKFTGYLDNMSTFVINQTFKEVFMNYGVEMVIFKTIHDSRRTTMCRTLDNQKFYINKMNIYDRYSATDDKNVIYHTNGLVVGDNLPPINNHFHWCRSWIEPFDKRNITDLSGNNLNDKERNGIITYLGSESYKINDNLRKSIELTDYQKNICEDFDNALNKMPIYRGYVQRSVNFVNQKQLNKILLPFNNTNKIGGWKSYTSSSLNTYDETFNLQFNILSRTGRNLSYFNDEGGGEIVFYRNTQFKFVDYKVENGKIYIDLEEVE